MKITKEWLQEKRACSNGVDWFIHQKTPIKIEGLDVVKKLIRQNSLDWANWLVVRLMFEY